MELDSPPLYFEWGKSLEKFNRLNEAKEKYLKALEYDSESVEILSYLGLCCAEREEYSEAEAILEKVLAKAPENKVAKQISAIIAYAMMTCDLLWNFLGQMMKIILMHTI